MACLSLNTVVAADEVNLTGSVRGRHNEVKQFVSVQLEGSRRYVAMTNAQGEFNIPSFVPGLYTVRIRQGDYLATFPAREIGNARLDLTVNW
jgi:hypothetical protein